MEANVENSIEDTEMAECDGEKVVTMMDVLQEQQEFEDDANAVLGASDDQDCTYSKGYIKRQAIYACLTCCADAKTDETKRAGVCLACSLNCHENHELIELYTKRNFRCDCGNPKFSSHPCQFTPNKLDLNIDNSYNQNFSGLYCVCHRPYPDPDATIEDEMIQCIICEDWLHASHLEATVPSSDQYSEMICKGCMEKNEFLHDYSELAVNIGSTEVDVVTVYGTEKLNGSTNGDHNLNNETNENLVEKPLESTPEGGEGKQDDHKIVENGDVDMNGGETPAEPADKSVETNESQSTVVVKPVMETDKTETSPSEITENKEDSKPEENLTSEVPKPETDATTESDVKSSESPETETNPTESKEDTKSLVTEKDTETNPSDITEKDVTSDIPNPEDTTETSVKGSEDKGSENIPDKKVQETIQNESSTDDTKIDSEVTDEDSSKVPSQPNESVDENTELDNKTENVDTSNMDTTESDNIIESTAASSTDNVENAAVSIDNTITTDDAKPDSNSTKDENCDNKETNGDLESKESDLEPKANHSPVTEKRKLSTEDASDNCSKKPKLDCIRPKHKKLYKGATFWPSSFRQKLCTCSECITMYKDLSVLFLVDPEDTVTAYETLGQEKIDGEPKTQYEKGLQALSSLDRIQQINALTEYNKMRDKLLDFLKSFKDRKEVVKEEDIKAFFAGMKPKREPDGVYFCR